MTFSQLAEQSSEKNEIAIRSLCHGAIFGHFRLPGSGIRQTLHYSQCPTIRYFGALVRLLNQFAKR